MVQRSGRFKTAHTGRYLSAKAYRAVRRFETALYGALLRGQSKKNISILFTILSFLGAYGKNNGMNTRTSSSFSISWTKDTICSAVFFGTDFEA
jgi:hypothetical protein